MTEQDFGKVEDGMEACIKRIHSGTGKGGDMENLLEFVKPLVWGNAAKYQGPIPDGFAEHVVDLQEVVWEATLAFSPEKVEGHIVPAYLLYIGQTLKNYRAKMAIKRKRFNPIQLDEPTANCLVDNRPNPEEIFFEEVEESMLHEALAKLPDIDRELLLRHCRDHVSNDKLAELYKDQNVGCGEAVRKRNIKNREKVLKMMEHKSGR